MHNFLKPTDTYIFLLILYIYTKGGGRGYPLAHRVIKEFTCFLHCPICLSHLTTKEIKSSIPMTGFVHYL